MQYVSKYGRKAVRNPLFTLFIGLLFVRCSDGMLDTSIVSLNEDEISTNPPEDYTIKGTVWEPCAIGQTYDQASKTCLGEKAEIPCESVGEACPEGTVLPSKKDFENLLCGLMGSMDDVCPHERYASCKDCAQCTALFGNDAGRYPVREHIISTEHLDTEYYVGDIVFFETGCATDDAYPDTLCNVRCIQSPESICGDSIVIGTEACDDGNTLSNDGCSATCVIEEGYACPPAGGPCEKI